MVFARKADDALASLVKQIDQLIADHEELASFVSFLGPDEEAAQNAARDFSKKYQVQHVALVVPKQYENGPGHLKIDPEAEVTVVLYRDKKVVANHAVGPGGLNDEAINAIIADTGEILQ